MAPGGCSVAVIPGWNVAVTFEPGRVSAHPRLLRKIAPIAQPGYHNFQLMKIAGILTFTKHLSEAVRD